MPELCHVKWPNKFRPDVSNKFDGNTNPIEFLQVYSMACLAAHRDEKFMDNWFALALKPKARSWIMKLPPNSVQ
jgi:hypothetical protein